MTQTEASGPPDNKSGLKQSTKPVIKGASHSRYFDELARECQLLANYAFNKGIQVPANLMKLLSQQHQLTTENRAEQLTTMHNRLVELVAPAKPETIVLMAQEQEKGSVFLFLGRVPLIRKMMVVSIVSLIALIALSLSSYINNENMVASMFDMEGTRLLYVQAILMASAAIGASFSALFKANSYVTAGVYDPKYESSYWVRFVVGLIAGIILTQLIPVNLESVAAKADELSGGVSGSNVSQAALRITMALIGGFSASLVYKVLERIVETIQSFISPNVPPDPEILKAELTNLHHRERLQFMSALTAEIGAIQQQLVQEPELATQQAMALLSQLQDFITNYEGNVK